VIKQNYLILIEAVYDSQGESSNSLLKKKPLGEQNFLTLSKNLNIILTAYPEEVPPGTQRQPSQERISLYELQNLLFAFSSLACIDPGTSDKKFFSSIPFYHLETFEDLCQHVLFPYV